MKFIVIGPARYGKTTFARALAEARNTQFTDTSEPIVIVEEARQRRLGIDRADDTWDFTRDRPNRQHLVALGDAMKLLNPTIFVDYGFQRGEIVSGVRRKDELTAAMRKHLSAITIYIDRPGYPRDPADSFDIEPLPWMTVVSGDCVADLERAAKFLAKGRCWGV